MRQPEASMGKITWPDADVGRPWDETFARWARLAHAQGLADPNDVGDQEWNDPLPHLQACYFPHLRADSVVLELGPGSGRITRHLIGRCREMILIDYSEAVCQWLTRYLAGKGTFQAHAISTPAWPMVASASVDFVCAFGVFEHIGLDDMRWYIEEMKRVLRPSGTAVFNFDNFMSPEGFAWHTELRREPGHQHIFRFYHPEMVRRLAENAGLAVMELRTSDSRHAEIELKNPAS